MYKIFKYPLDVTDVQTLKLPVGATILTAMNQFETICIWAKISTTSYDAKKFRDRTIYIFGTGNPVPNVEMKYINSVALEGGRLIFHVFESLAPKADDKQ